MERHDLIVVGGGPGGLAAAVAAARSGRRSLLIDDGRGLGGQIWRDDVEHGLPRAARALVDEAVSRGVMFTSGAVVSVDGPRELLIDCDGTPRWVTAPRVVLACGARELFLPFPGWTLPGVFGAGGFQALVKGGLEIAGSRVAVAGSGPLLLAVAAFARRRGATVVRLAEQASGKAISRFAMGLWRHPRKLGSALGLRWQLAGVTLQTSSWPRRALGNGRLEAVAFTDRRGRVTEVACDHLACGFGLVPNTGLAQLLGAAVREGAVEVDASQRTRADGVFAVGEMTGVGGVDCALAEGFLAGHLAAEDARAAEPWLARRDRERRFAERLDRAYALDPMLRSLPRDDTILCRCEDVTFGQARGSSGAREARLITRCGMGSCQGRICGPAASFLLGWAASEPRVPLVPVPLSFLATLAQKEARRSSDQGTSPSP